MAEYPILDVDDPGPIRPRRSDLIEEVNQWRAAAHHRLDIAHTNRDRAIQAEADRDRWFARAQQLEDEVERLTRALGDTEQRAAAWWDTAKTYCRAAQRWRNRFRTTWNTLDEMTREMT